MILLEKSIMFLIKNMRWNYQHKDDPFSIWNAPIAEVISWIELLNENKTTC